jgi:hypothetical protein
MPSLQDQLKNLLPAWEEEQSRIEQTKQINQNPKATMEQVTTRHLFKPTNNASRETFNAVRDFPNQQPSFYANMLEKKGFKHNTVRSLIYQMSRQGQFYIDAHGNLSTKSNAYVPIKSTKVLKVIKPKNPAMVKEANAPVQPAAGIAALPPQDSKPKVTRSLIINHTWDAQKEVDKLSVMQARALYDLLKTIFGG